MGSFCGGLRRLLRFNRSNVMSFKRGATHGHGRCFGWRLARLKLQLGAKTGADRPLFADAALCRDNTRFTRHALNAGWMCRLS
ncbi:uncharacterized [Tachysurus ichikawai]